MGHSGYMVIWCRAATRARARMRTHTFVRRDISAQMAGTFARPLTCAYMSVWRGNTACYARALRRDEKLYFDIIRMSSLWSVAGILVRSVMSRDMCPGLCVVSRARVKQTQRFMQLGDHVMKSSMWHGCVHNPKRERDNNDVAIQLDMVPRGLEPRTLRLLAVRSNQLSYETFAGGSWNCYL